MACRTQSGWRWRPLPDGRSPRLHSGRMRGVVLFYACYNQIMANATGSAERWNTSHRGYFCLYNGHPPNKKDPIDYHITPETEAYALLVIRGNYRCWHAQFLTTNKCPTYKQKCIHTWHTAAAVIQASNDIKEQLCRGQNNVDELTALSEGWLTNMKLPFEGDIPAPAAVAANENDSNALKTSSGSEEEKPNQVRVFLATVHMLFAHLLTPFCPLIFYRFSFRKWKEKAPTRPTIGPPPIVKSSKTLTQRLAAGSKILSAAKYNQHLDDVKKAYKTLKT